MTDAPNTTPAPEAAPVPSLSALNTASGIRYAVGGVGGALVALHWLPQANIAGFDTAAFGVVVAVGGLASIFAKNAKLKAFLVSLWNAQPPAKS